MESLVLLRSTMPAWFAVKSATGNKVDGVAEIMRESAVRPAQYALTILGAGVAVTVAEETIGIALPKACPDRHINPGGTFCLGLNLTTSVVNRTAAGLWWASLREFLCYQEVARRTGHWPGHV